LSGHFFPPATPAGGRGPFCGKSTAAASPPAEQPKYVPQHVVESHRDRNDAEKFRPPLI
jgi:hypothetical protein